MTILRQACRGDITGMHRVRLAVRENRLSSPDRISEADYITEIESPGRGWVIETGGEIVGFAIGNSSTGNIWALFVDPHHEGRGHGRRLHDVMIDWLGSRGRMHLWLTTAPGTRAQHFYEAAGWRCTGPVHGGELRFVREVP
jgi:GNAT superfamily N-acetyltransferase